MGKTHSKWNAISFFHHAQLEAWAFSLIWQNRTCRHCPVPSHITIFHLIKYVGWFWCHWAWLCDPWVKYMSGKYPYLVINRDTKRIVHRRDLQSTRSYSYLDSLKSVPCLQEKMWEKYEFLRFCYEYVVVFFSKIYSGRRLCGLSYY